jgi:very-short-patch-repair endonuclease
MYDFARLLRKNPTDAERFLWSKLRRRQLGAFRFRRQRPIGPYICDFVCVEAQVIIEPDGSQHVEHTNYDTRRDLILRSNGYRILRFWNADVMHRTDSVLETIFEAMHRKEMDGRFG